MDLIGESLASVHIHELLELSTLRKLHMPFSNAQRPGKTKQENQDDKCILHDGPHYVVTIINQESACQFNQLYIASHAECKIKRIKSPIYSS